MRKLTIIILCVAALYAGYWWIGARGVDRALENTLTTAQELGWNVDYATLNTTGFPSRFDVNVTELAVTSPSGAFGYQAPFAQTLALSYRPNQIIAIFAPQQRLRFGETEVIVATDAMRGRVDVSANTTLDLQNLTVEASAVKLDGGAWQATIEQALLAIQPNGPPANTYATYLNLTDISAPTAFGVSVGDATLVLDAIVTLDRPLDRGTARDWMTATPSITQISVSALDLEIGTQRLTGSGDLTVSADGTPVGKIDLEITGWRAVLDLLVQAGVVDQGRMPLIGGIVGMLSGPNGAVNLPLIFQNGQMLLGPVPLGPAPRLR